jgi:Fe2+ transport system protein FeoA
MITTMTLDQLPPATTSTVLSVVGEPRLRRRLLELGLVPGIPVTLVRRAPLGDALVVHVRGYDLSLRRDEAALVEIR